MSHICLDCAQIDFQSLFLGDRRDFTKTYYLADLGYRIDYLTCNYCLRDAVALKGPF